MAEKDKHDKTVKQTASLEQFIHGASKNISARLPAHVDKQRFILGVMTAIQKNPALRNCNPQSVLLAAYDAAEQGCSLSPSLQLGWIIPYKEEAQFQPSYRFYIQRAYATGDVKNFFAEVVYEGDLFKRTFAPRKNLQHEPGAGERVREKAIGAYALIEFDDGDIDYEYLTKDQIERHRNCSKQPNSMKWKEFWEEGWRITPIRVLAKRLPLKSEKIEELVEMINKDSEREINIPVEQYSEPSMPRRQEQEEEAAPKQQEGQQQAADQKKESPKDSKDKKSNGGSMFPAEEGQEQFLTGAEIGEFWSAALDAGWKKEQVIEMLKKDFGVSALKDLPRSKMQSALDVVRAARE